MKNNSFKYHTLFILFLVSLTFTSLKGIAAVAPPSLRCVSVGINGSVTLTWAPPADPNGEFLSYVVYSSISKTGPYTQTPVLGLGTNSFNDPVNANGSSFYYFVQTVYDDGSGPTASNSSDTAQSMLPVFTAASDSTCTIQWDPVFSPNTVTSLGVYTIFRKIGSGPYVFAGTTNYGTEIFNDVFKVCSDSVYYRIEIEDQIGCVSTSGVLKNLFEDNAAPASPVIDSITVDPITGNVVLHWKPSTSPDTYGYIVYYFEKITSTYIYRDTIYGRFNTTYEELLGSIDPEIELQQYTVAAFDSCYNPTPNISAGSLDHRTIHLTIIPNNCENTVTLSWNSYINWPALGGYDIMISVNGNPFQPYITLADTDTVYTHTKTNSLDIFCYRIRAFDDSKTLSSTSNTACAFSNSLIVPKKQYFKQITVEDNQSIHIISLTDTTLPVAQYVLLRSLEPKNNFYEVDRIRYKNKEIIELHDYEANVNETSYFYRIGIIDTCGTITYVSRPSNSMLLKGEMNDDSLNVSLNWNPYTSWDSVGSGVANYQIYQVLDGKRELLNTVDKFTHDYKFTIANNIQDGANFCYEIEARENSGNFFNQIDSALSNRVCFTKNLNVFVPNAFRPGGANPIFTPVVSFGQLATFQMTVYDRWGKIMYETSSIDNGWDGTVDGKLAPFGAYIYYIQVSNFAGSTYTTKGTVILLR